MRKVQCIGLNDEFLGEYILEDRKRSMKNFLPNEEMDLDNKGRIENRSKQRVHVTCPLFNKCGGCQALHLKYNTQLEMKKEFVNKFFQSQKLGVEVSKIHPSPKVNHYRNKVIAAAANVNFKIEFGLYEESSKNILPMTKCLLENETAHEVLQEIRTLCQQMKIEAHDSKRGVLKNILIRVSEATDDVLVTFVTSEDMFHGSKNLVQALTKKVPKIKTIIQNINQRDTSVVLGDKEKVLYGPGYITDKIGDLSFKISSKTFYQVNPKQMVNLYNRALELANINSNDKVLDCYSGIGTISLIAAKKAKEVVSVELNRDSHQNAIGNAKHNKITNVNFVNADATKFMMQERQKGKYDAVIMDPPRSGSTKEFMDAMMNIEPKRIVYVSCDYKTLARDLAHLKTKYDIKAIELFDMFCHTYHIEVLVCLTKKS